jgi:hypothetical protein
MDALIRPCLLTCTTIEGASGPVKKGSLRANIVHGTIVTKRFTYSKYIPVLPSDEQTMLSTYRIWALPSLTPPVCAFISHATLPLLFFRFLEAQPAKP